MAGLTPSQRSVLSTLKRVYAVAARSMLEAKVEVSVARFPTRALGGKGVIITILDPDIANAVISLLERKGIIAPEKDCIQDSVII